jgi:tRNA-splicing ligase RtcB
MNKYSERPPAAPSIYSFFHRVLFMGKLKLRGKDLIKLGYPEGPAIGMAINMMLKHHRKKSKLWVLSLLKEVIEHPDQYVDDEVLGRIVATLKEKEAKQEMALREELPDYPVFGRSEIEDGALQQMNVAMQLPVTAAGALMPDAHQGYGLPIGGVLAVENAVIPFGVGVDIGCRMCLSVYDRPAGFLENKRAELKDILVKNTRFGFDAFDRPMDDAIFERPEFREIPKLKSLRQKAVQQIGSSGGGNHFVEFGIVSLEKEPNLLNLPAGTYLAVLSHSGSRGLGANIANHYTKLAMEKTLLPKKAKHLAWLSLDSEEGMEYWLAMNLAGDYASACHHHIHHRIGAALGEQPIARVENHHNFAWKEVLADGREVIVHRKGATPAKKGELGVIPGSMTAPGFIVAGKGSPYALQSASHGAGRLMSRRQAKESIAKKDFKQHLKQHQVDLIGGDLDEAPFAYKDIHKVMDHQQDLVEVVGLFYPKVVRMADAGKR